MCCLSKQSWGGTCSTALSRKLLFYFLLPPCTISGDDGYLASFKLQKPSTKTPVQRRPFLFTSFACFSRNAGNTEMLTSRDVRRRGSTVTVSRHLLYMNKFQFFQNCIYMGFVHSRVLKLLLTGSRLSTSFTCRPPCFPFSRDSGQEQPTEELVKNKRFREGVTLK